MIDQYAHLNKGRILVFTSMGQLRYLSAIKFVDAVIGNSSSGIIEAPACHIPTVNIGNRQSGRLKSDSIIDCTETTDSIVTAISKALSPSFRRTVKQSISFYGYGDTAAQIKNALKKNDLLTIKKFYDL